MNVLVRQANVTTKIAVVSTGPQGAKGDAGSGSSVLQFSKTAGAALGGHRAVVIDDNGKAIHADKDTAGHSGAVVGITTGAAVLDASVTLQNAGEITEASWTWTPRQPVYLANDGQLTQTPPTTGFLQQLGTATGATTLEVNIQQSIELV